MSSTHGLVPEVQTLATGLLLGESPRWHDSRLWFADWGAHELLAIDLAGRREVILRVPSVPFSIDWLPNGPLVIVSARDRLLLRREPDGRLVTHADLSHLSDRPWNEIVADGRGNVYVNNIGVGSFSDVVDCSEEEWNAALDVNLRTTFLASKHTVPVMIDRGGGAIVI